MVDDEAVAAKFDEAPLKGPLRVRGVQQRMAVLEQVIREGKAEGTQLCADFQAQFPRAPAKLVLYGDKSFTFYRWRQSSARQWGSRSTSAINLMGEAGQALLARVPESARPHWLAYERRRIDLNTRLSMATYELYRLQDWLDVLEQVKRVERNGLLSPAIHNGAG